jgi:hypothetical protein
LIHIKVSLANGVRMISPINGQQTSLYQYIMGNEDQFYKQPKAKKMKNLILAAALIYLLPALAAAEMKMQNTNPSPAEKPEHVMRNASPSPEQRPEHVMRNANPNSSNSGSSAGTEATESPVDIQHLKKEK